MPELIIISTQELVTELNQRQKRKRIKLWISGYDNSLNFDILMTTCKKPCSIHCHK